MEAADIIRQHLNDDVYTLSAKDKWHAEYDKLWLVQQIQSRQKARSKLPSWYGNFDLLFPPPLSVEQSSSELAAAYKAEVAARDLPACTTLIDMTGGMGVDACAFARHFQKVVFVEKQEHLAELARHNFRQLGLPQIEIICADSTSYVQNIANSDCIFIDPARRQNGRKVFLIEDCEPNIAGLIPLLMAKTRRILIKLSPMFDLTTLVRTLPQIAEIHIVAVHNEVKELLVLMEEEAAAPALFCTNLETEGRQTLRFEWEQRSAAAAIADGVGRYLYEPHPAVMKSGMMNALANQLCLRKLHPHSHLYTSDELCGGFMGRTFQVEAVFGMGKAELKAGLQGIGQANITVRNFPLTEPALRKKLALKDGGDITLFATTNGKGKHILVKCRMQSAECRI